MSNEKDKELALSIPLGVSCFCGVASEESICDRHQQIIDTLTTASKEAFKDAAKIVAELPVQISRLGVKKGSDMNGWTSAINQAVGVLLEAAATTEKPDPEIGSSPRTNGGA